MDMGRKRIAGGTSPRRVTAVVHRRQFPRFYFNQKAVQKKMRTVRPEASPASRASYFPPGGRCRCRCRAAPTPPAPAPGPGCRSLPAAPGGPGAVRLAVVGDVHDQWSAADAAALGGLGADVAVFVGDFGNENLGLVERVGALEHEKAVILGNHDAWHTMYSRRRTRRGRVDEQLRALGDSHVGYAAKAWPEKRLSVVGARPFSAGPKPWKAHGAFYKGRYGVAGYQQSAARIADVARRQPDDHALVVLGHSGPAGLGEKAYDICGVDWQVPGGDHGDADLRAALNALHAEGRAVACCLFGHMHEALNGRTHPGKKRRMVAVDRRGVVYVNAAVVPRVVVDGARTRHNFTLVDLSGRDVAAVWEVWVAPAAEGGWEAVESNRWLKPGPSPGTVQVWDGFTGKFRTLRPDGPAEGKGPAEDVTERPRPTLIKRRPAPQILKL